MTLYRWKDHIPKIGEEVWVCPDTQVIGQVELHSGANIWFACVLRGDSAPITVGRNTNIQDLSVIHASPNIPVQIGENCTVGHKTILHACVLKNYSFVGMGSIMLDRSELGEYSFLGAGSLLPPGRKIPDGMLAIGSPARPVRKVTEEEREMIRKRSEEYKTLADSYREPNGFIPV